MGRTVETRDGNWFKPTVVNDWGSDAYFESAVKSDHGTWGHGEQDKAKRIRAGQRFLVKWPSGKVSCETVSGRRRRGTVMDMGHEYETSSDELFIQSEVNGSPVRVNISELWLKRMEPEDG